DRGERDQEADRRGDERLADLAHQILRDLATGAAELVEGADDPDDGAEQPDEGGVVADRADEGEVALHRETREAGLRAHALLGARGAVLRRLEGRVGDARLERLARREALLGALVVAAAHALQE